MLKEEGCQKLLYKIRPQGPTFKYYPHRASLNYYIGCHHGCEYCYACYTMKNVGWEPDDFSKNILVKVNALEILEKELERKVWKDYTGIIHLGTVQDPYQPIEKEYQYTRKVLEMFLDKGIPVTILTKSDLIERDIDILKCMAERNLVHIDFSIAYLDEKLRNQLEPGTPSFERRFETLKKLKENNISTGIFINPVIPVFTEESIENLIIKAKEYSVKYVLLGFIHLPRNRYKIVKSILESVREDVEYDKYFNFNGRRVVMEEELRYDLTKKVNELSLHYHVPFITTEFHEFITGNYNFGVFKKRYPLLFDYINLLKSKKNNFVSLDEAVQLAQKHNCEKSYFSSLKWYWNNGKLFDNLKHLNIQMKSEEYRVSYMLVQ